MTERRDGIVMENVTFAYGTTLAIEKANLIISDREFVAIIGPNGGGKTTLVKLMMGLLRPDKGRIRVYGETPRRSQRSFGYVPQYPSLDSQFPATVMDVVLMGRLGFGTGLGPFGRSARKLATKALQEVSAEHLSGKPFSRLSGGERQRVLIARALVTHPQVLVLDEPTASLDPGIQDDFPELLHRLNSRMTVIVVSHDVGFVSRHVKMVICVNKEVVLHETASIDGEFMKRLYGESGVRMVDHHHDHHHDHQ